MAKVTVNVLPVKELSNFDYDCSNVSFYTPRGDHLWSVQGVGNVEEFRAIAIRQIELTIWDSGFERDRLRILLNCAVVKVNVDIRYQVVSNIQQLNWSSLIRHTEMTAQEKERIFIANAPASADRWCVEFKDGSTKDYKHIYGGAEQLASMLNWELVEVHDGVPAIGDI